MKSSDTWLGYIFELFLAKRKWWETKKKILKNLIANRCPICGIMKWYTHGRKAAYLFYTLTEF